MVHSSFMNVYLEIIRIYRYFSSSRNISIYKIRYKYSCFEPRKDIKVLIYGIWIFFTRALQLRSYRYWGVSNSTLFETITSCIRKDILKKLQSAECKHSSKLIDILVFFTYFSLKRYLWYFSLGMASHRPSNISWINTPIEISSFYAII